MPVSINNYYTTSQRENLQSTVRIEKKYQDLKKSYGTSITTTSVNDYFINTKIFRLLKKCSELTDNWDEDDAKAPTSEVIHISQYLAFVLSKTGQIIFHAAPGPNGEIMLDLRNKDKSLELIIYPHKKVAVKIPSVGAPSQLFFEETDLSLLLQWLNVKD